MRSRPPRLSRARTRMPRESARRRSFLGPAGWPLARLADVIALLVLHRAVGADHRRSIELVGVGLPHLGIQQPCRKASTLDITQRRARWVAQRDRGLAAESREREGAAGVDL